MIVDVPLQIFLLYYTENVRILINYSGRSPYYSGIIPDSFCHRLFQKLFRHNVRMPI